MSFCNGNCVPFTKNYVLRDAEIMFPFLTRMGPLEYSLVRLLEGRNFQLDISILADSKRNSHLKRPRLAGEETHQEGTTHELDWEDAGGCVFMRLLWVWG